MRSKRSLSLLHMTRVRSGQSAAITNPRTHALVVVNRELAMLEVIGISVAKLTNVFGFKLLFPIDFHHIALGCFAAVEIEARGAVKIRRLALEHQNAGAFKLEVSPVKFAHFGQVHILGVVC